eukprot:g12988.t1
MLLCCLPLLLSPWLGRCSTAASISQHGLFEHPDILLFSSRRAFKGFLRATFMSSMPLPPSTWLLATQPVDCQSNDCRQLAAAVTGAADYLAEVEDVNLIVVMQRPRPAAARIQFYASNRAAAGLKRQKGKAEGAETEEDEEDEEFDYDDDWEDDDEAGKSEADDDEEDEGVAYKGPMDSVQLTGWVITHLMKARGMEDELPAHWKRAVQEHEKEQAQQAPAVDLKAVFQAHTQAREAERRATLVPPVILEEEAARDDIPAPEPVRVLGSAADLAALRAAEPGRPWMLLLVVRPSRDCERLLSDWDKLAQAPALAGRVSLATLDCSNNKTDCTQRFNVEFYPAVRGFYALNPPQGAQGPELDREAFLIYSGEETAVELSKFAYFTLYTATLPQARLVQLTSKQVFLAECAARACVVAIVPPLGNTLQTGPEARQAFLDGLLQVAQRLRQQPYGFAWAVAGDHPGLELALKLRQGKQQQPLQQPRVGAVHYPSLKSALYRKELTPEGVYQFCSKLRLGGLKLHSFDSADLRLYNVEAWSPPVAQAPRERHTEL